MFFLENFPMSTEQKISSQPKKSERQAQNEGGHKSALAAKYDKEISISQHHKDRFNEAYAHTGRLMQKKRQMQEERSGPLQAACELVTFPHKDKESKNDSGVLQRPVQDRIEDESVPPPEDFITSFSVGMSGAIKKFTQLFKAPFSQTNSANNEEVTGEASSKEAENSNRPNRPEFFPAISESVVIEKDIQPSSEEQPQP